MTLTILKIERRARKYHPSEGFRAMNAKARVYVFHEGETILEGFGNRAARPNQLYRQHVLPAVREFLGAPATKFAWSRHAGCSMCPCSPGFIANDLYGFDVHGTITNAPATTNPELAAARRGQLEAQL